MTTSIVDRSVRKHIHKLRMDHGGPTGNDPIAMPFVKRMAAALAQDVVEIYKGVLLERNVDPIPEETQAIIEQGGGKSDG